MQWINHSRNTHKYLPEICFVKVNNKKNRESDNDRVAKPILCPSYRKEQLGGRA